MSVLNPASGYCWIENFLSLREHLLITNLVQKARKSRSCNALRRRNKRFYMRKLRKMCPYSAVYSLYKISELPHLARVDTFFKMVSINCIVLLHRLPSLRGKAMLSAPKSRRRCPVFFVFITRTTVFKHVGPRQYRGLNMTSKYSKKVG